MSSAPSRQPGDCAAVCLHPAAVSDARARVTAAPPTADIAALFAILRDPTRLQILLALGSSELCVCDIAAATGINRSTVSHQLRILRDRDLVRRRREGKVIYYSLADKRIVALLRMGCAHAGHAANTARVA